MGCIELISAGNVDRISAGESEVSTCSSVPPVNAMPSPTGEPDSI